MAVKRWKCWFSGSGLQLLQWNQCLLELSSSASPRWKVNSCNCWLQVLHYPANSQGLLIAESSQCVWGQREEGVHTSASNWHTLTWRNQHDDNSESHRDKEPKEGQVFKTPEKQCLRKQQGFLTQRMQECPALCIIFAVLGAKGTENQESLCRSKASSLPMHASPLR